MITNVLGVDIGGSHITAAMVDLQSKKIISQSLKRSKVDAHQGVDEIIKTWADVMGDTTKACADFSGKIGIAMPGPFDYEQGISLIKDQDKYDALYGVNVKALLAEKLSLKAKDIQMMNDAACFLQGEVFAGAAIGFERAIGITLGTGLGSARYFNGKAEDAALWCLPFKNGIAEDYLAGRWILKRYKEKSGEAAANVKDISERYHSDQFAAEVFAEFGKTLGEFLVLWIKKDDPEVLVFGGNISNAKDLFLPFVEKYLQGHNVEIAFKKAILGEEAALLGAASLWK